jgi:penicillin-binding protein 1A
LLVKQGTTQNQSDGWFMGMVPNLVTGVCRLEDRSARFKSITSARSNCCTTCLGLLYETLLRDENLKVSKGEFDRLLTFR